MQFSVTFRHMEATDALKNYARERMGRIRKYFPEPIAVHVVLSTERGYNHRVDVTLQLHNGMTVAGHEATENMYAAIDQVTAKIERQVRRYKDKLRAHNTHGRRPLDEPVPWSHTVVAGPSVKPALAGDEAAPDAADKVNGTAVVDSAPTNGQPVVIKTRQLHANPMSVTQAIDELNGQGKQFLVFRHNESGWINVVYRREDGSYGLIETPEPS